LAEPLYLGIDVGTGGVRAIVADGTGRVAAEGRAPLSSAAGTPDGHHEQDPEHWWSATREAIAGMLEVLNGSTVGSHSGSSVSAGARSGSTASGSPEQIVAASVDGTSGTVVCVDADGRALGNAIMYNDGRAQAQAEHLSDMSGVSIAPSWAIARLLWLAELDPLRYERTRWVIHQADYIASRLTGCFGGSDYSNALKMGYDMNALAWPDWLGKIPGAVDRVPAVAAPADDIGQIDPDVADELGLPRALRLYAGATDGTAGFLASGASLPGQVNTTLGTTLVLKAISSHFVVDPAGMIYCHRLPGGLWLPGAASSTGGEWIRSEFAGQDLAVLDDRAATMVPTDALVWPLVRQGERFPILSPTFQGFRSGGSGGEPAGEDRYAAMLQGTAMVERLCYDALQAVMGQPLGEVYSTGGGSSSDVWMQMRSNVTGRLMHRPSYPEAALGAAVLAAAGHQATPVMSAVQEMVQIERSFTPDRAQQARYDDLYGRFCQCVKEISAKEGGAA
jgi:D-ribulokinase